MATHTSCPQCGSSNPTDARFCIECGLSMARAATGPTTRLRTTECPHCRQQTPSDARFCVVCGRGFGQPTPAPKSPSRPQVHPHISPTPQPHVVPIMPPPHMPAHHRQQQPQPFAGVSTNALLLIGLGILFVTHTFWPGILALIGVVTYVDKAKRGRSHSGLRALIWLVGLSILFATGSFWPGILILVGLNWFVLK